MPANVPFVPWVVVDGKCIVGESNKENNRDCAVGDLRDAICRANKAAAPKACSNRTMPKVGGLNVIEPPQVLVAQGAPAGSGKDARAAKKGVEPSSTSRAHTMNIAGIRLPPSVPERAERGHQEEVPIHGLPSASRGDARGAASMVKQLLADPAQPGSKVDSVGSEGLPVKAVKVQPVQAKQALSLKLGPRRGGNSPGCALRGGVAGSTLARGARGKMAEGPEDGLLHFEKGPA